MSSSTSIDMSQEESIRKIMQLRPLFTPSDQSRGFDVEHMLSTDLSFLVKSGEVDMIGLIPFLISTVQGLLQRVDALEAEIKEIVGSN